MLLNGAVVLRIASFMIGMIAGPDRFAPVATVFEGGFRRVLCLFLLDLGPILFLTITSRTRADQLTDALADLLDSHGLLLTIGRVEVIRGAKFT